MSCDEKYQVDVDYINSFLSSGRMSQENANVMLDQAQERWASCKAVEQQAMASFSRNAIFTSTSGCKKCGK